MLEQSPVSSAWRAESAWDVVAPKSGHSGNPNGAGVILTPLGHVDMATLIVRRTEMAAFQRLVAEQWGFGVPTTGRAQFGPRGGLVWSAPNQWLALGAPAATPDELASTLAGVAAVTAQGDGRAMVEVDGPCARQTLAKCLSIDLHLDVFSPGCTAVTAFAHMSVQVWQAEGSPAFTLCVPRTVAGSVWNLLIASSAEYGLTVERAGA